MQGISVALTKIHDALLKYDASVHSAQSLLAHSAATIKILAVIPGGGREARNIKI